MGNYATVTSDEVNFLDHIPKERSYRLQYNFQNLSWIPALYRKMKTQVKKYETVKKLSILYGYGYNNKVHDNQIEHERNENNEIYMW